jgi:hypothetical protein
MKRVNENVQRNYCVCEVNKKHRTGSLMLRENMISCILYNCVVANYVKRKYRGMDKREDWEKK